MAKDEFNLEQLDKMYDEAMAWKPPSQAAPPGVSPYTDPRGILKNLLAKKQAQNQYNLNEGQQIG